MCLKEKAVKDSAVRRKKKQSRLITRLKRGLVVLMLCVYASSTTVFATPYGKESSESKSVQEKLWSEEEVNELMNEVLEIAREEIEKTAAEAGKAVAKEIGSELAYEKSMHESYEQRSLNLERENKLIKEEAEKLKRQNTLYLCGCACFLGVAVLSLGSLIISAGR